ncbi:MAG: hypothetical protein JO079_04330 [Frankiaceae bacterium]|nr:hypothetical protein [Frankiaceae bacterium]MBV9368499.1 hypothetical protein [Frankiales bacterium]
MATRFDQPVVRRPALPLTARDERDLATLRRETPEREALARLAGEAVPADASEGLLLHTLLAVALARVREEVEANGYAELAAQRTGEASERRAVARRRPPSWANEE